MFVNKLFTYSHNFSRAQISKGKRYFKVKSSTYYFHLKTKILADFQTCISLTLSVEVTEQSKSIDLFLYGHNFGV